MAASVTRKCRRRHYRRIPTSYRRQSNEQRIHDRVRPGREPRVPAGRPRHEGRAHFAAWPPTTRCARRPTTTSKASGPARRATTWCGPSPSPARSTNPTRRSTSGSTTASSTPRPTASTSTSARRSRTRPRSSSRPTTAPSPRSPTRNCWRASRQFANALKAQGIQKGDRVIIYMPMTIEGVVAMQACARIGATHSVVFGGFSAKALQERIIDAGAVAVITANYQLRGGKELPLKAIVDDGIALGGCESIKTVLVYQRTPTACNMVAGRDKTFDEALQGPEQPSARRCRWAPSIRCSSSTPRARPASPRACSTPPAATCCGPSSRWTGPSTSGPRTCSGAPPTSAGSPATPTSPTARWRPAPRRWCSKASRPSRTPAASGR